MLYFFLDGWLFAAGGWLGIFNYEGRKPDTGSQWL